MEIVKCCEMIEGILDLSCVNIVWKKEKVFMGDAFDGYPIEYCPNCGRKIRFMHIFKIQWGREQKSH